MAVLRQRKGSRGKEPPQPPAADSQAQQRHQANCCSQHHHHDDLLQGDWSWGWIVWTSVGWSVSVGLGLLCCMYMATLHENDLWFSNIKEVEREISFRTECGLYYSYYKQMLKAPSILEGLSELIHDNLTESKRTINILQRMNIYQEVFLSVLYRVLPIQQYLEPMYFYIYSVFSLQAVYVMALYLTAWLLAGSWLAGALAAVWYILNRVDTTRVEFTISLRENWSLPFLALQVAAITCYLRPQLGALQQKLMVWLMYVCGLCFCVTWQFNQFIFLVQALVIYTLDCADVFTASQATTLYLVQVSALLSVWLLQFFNSMILGSLVLSFVTAALLPSLKTGSVVVRVSKLIIHSTAVLLLTLAFNFLAKKALQLRSDEHIFKFIKSKFARGPTRDFDANLYLCEEAFGSLPLDTLERLSATLLLGPYSLTLALMGGALALAALRNLRWAVSRIKHGEPEDLRPKGGATEKKANIAPPPPFRPDVAYNLLHTFFYGLLAFSTMRMKYIWTGHMCAVAAYGVCGRDVWAMLLHALRCNTKVMLRLVRYAAPLAITAFLVYKFWPKMVEELSDLREFYDPDTVELMTWISTKTPERAVVAGSMQLLAGIKLCTGRVITNHPHYEDKDLRDRTKQVYQVYARRSPQEVHAILQKMGADYVVLENSICYERRHQRGCRLRDLLDLANGHIMDGEGPNDADLVDAAHPRFCDAVKSDSPEYTALFKRTFRNKTFHVYRVKKKAKKNDKKL
ncbi:probable C-mannosyltransferase DPY19L3 isoform X2 [Corythoichthys intestinalis]|uniref:probable C-mannosyltransferase DPY19L3 isoform X2 n=1 Tax=Corythoichthys intestinalis TaxID=161448 RepID=UPI0025A5CD62|nr:probable C-mannosyltransferase DPY19L3 isoform X2 [Corythoichthys intestinalis]